MLQATSLIFLANVLIEWSRPFLTSSVRYDFYKKKELLEITFHLKIDSIVDKIDQMDRHKARQDNARDKLFNELGHKNGSSRRS